MSEEYQIEDEIEKFREEFDPLYKDVQNRIKDKVITKFL